MSDPCAQGLCNVKTIQQARDGVREGTLSWQKMQGPAVPDVSYAVPALLVVVGIIIGSAGGASIIGGLLVAGIGVAHGLNQWRRREEALAARAAWEASRWCVGCDKLRGPNWSKPTEAA